MSLYKDNQYLERNRTWHVEDSPWKARQALRLIERNRLEYPPERIAEVGCGAGEVLVQLQKMLPAATSFTGYDISPDLENFWEQRRGTGIEFLREDFLASEADYDLLLLIDVVEHIDDCYGFLRKVRDRARYKLFNFPLEIYAAKALLGSKYVDSWRTVGHIHFFNRDICLEALRYTGYRLIDDFYAPSAIDLAGTSTSVSLPSRLARLPRVLLSKVSVDLTAKLLGGYSLFVLAE